MTGSSARVTGTDISRYSCGDRFGSEVTPRRAPAHQGIFPRMSLRVSVG
jgi:hypothetical protein